MRERGIKEIIPLVANVLALEKMLDAASRNTESDIKVIKEQLESIDKPLRGDRKQARGLNGQAITLLASNLCPEVIELLEKAADTDAADVEIIDNLYFASLKADHIDDAKRYS